MRAAATAPLHTHLSDLLLVAARAAAVKRGREPISFTGDLHISNPSRSSALAYKVKTTEPDRYFVRPNQGVIATDTVARVRSESLMRC